MRKNINKKIIILESGSGNRLANQLWNFASVYALCLEKNYKCYNHSFFGEKKLSDNSISLHNYQQYFKNNFQGFLIRALYAIHLNKHFHKFFKPHRKYVKIIKILFPEKIIKVDHKTNQGKPTYLPPEKALDQAQEETIKKIENSSYKKLYFSGWLFRSPAGLKKYHKEVTEYLQPNKQIKKNIDNFINPLRKKYKIIIGVHIRQSDYRTYASGEFYFSPLEVNNILTDYLKHSKENHEDILFVVCSDEKIDLKIFSKLNVVAGPGKMMEDLFTLTLTDLIIGSNSTFGAFAAYYGNIPIAVFNRKENDWANIDLNKKEFNYKNDCTTVHL